MVLVGEHEPWRITDGTLHPRVCLLSRVGGVQEGRNGPLAWRPSALPTLQMGITHRASAPELHKRDLPDQGTP